MASFGEERTRSHSESDAYQKFPYRRIEPSVGKFITVLEANIDRLKKHRSHIEKCLAAADWPNLHSEQVNASRTVQQINATVREMEKARNQLYEDDLPKFDAKVSEVNKAAVAAVVEFMDKCGRSEVPLGGPAVLEVTHDVSNTDSCTDSVTDSPEAVLSPSSVQTYLIPDNSQAAESWEELRDSLVELNSLVHEFSTVVHDQQEKIDNIEDNINQAHDTVQQGVFSLSKTSKLKAVMYPFAGAVLGGVLGGPLGLFAGLKIGGAAAVGGGAVGFFSGRYLKVRQDKVQVTELENLSKKEPVKTQLSES